MTTERELEGPIPKSNPDPIDFFHNFVDDSSSIAAHPPPSPPSPSFKLNLGLSLSLGGFSGYGPIEENTRIRNEDEIVLQSTSIPAIEEEGSSMIARTFSFPLESEEERRRRKEMQSLKRMEAKRKREEKMKKAKEIMKREEKVVLEDGSDVNREDAGGQSCQKKVKNGVVLNGETAKWVRPAKQGSIGSQGSSEFDRKQKQGVDASKLGNCSDVKNVQPSPSSSNKTTPSPSNQSSPKNPNLSSKSMEDQPKRPNTDGESERNIMDEMPCVTTREVGPNGQKIEGFLYKYRSGADIRIVCVCHGKFLTPAEFVAHGGGSQVENPLRHIVISSTASGFL